MLSEKTWQLFLIRNRQGKRIRNNLKLKMLKKRKSKTSFRG